jgi:hypothetical protein
MQGSIVLFSYSAIEDAFVNTINGILIDDYIILIPIDVTVILFLSPSCLTDRWFMLFSFHLAYSYLFVGRIS